MAWVSNGPCPDCGSSDARGQYDDGSSYCFSCEKLFKAEAADEPQDSGSWLRGEYLPMASRGITVETLRKAGYQYDKANKLHIMNVRDPSGKLVAQKTRTKDKVFSWRGPESVTKAPPIYLSWLWPAKGKSVILCEGEIDALSYWQAWDCKYPVGSLPNGTPSTKKAILKHYEQLIAFDHVYLSFDNDEPGQKALEIACSLLPNGKVKIIRLPEDCKDANEALTKHGPQALIRGYYDASVFRPDGIREGSEFNREGLKRKRQAGFDLPWPSLNGMWAGLRTGEVTTLCAGSGIGKSTVAREIAYHMATEHQLKVGNIFLEESVETSVSAYVALHAGVPLKSVITNPDGLSDEAWDKALAEVVSPQMFYDHFGSIESNRLITMMRFMAASGCRFIVLDHISIVVSGVETTDERRDLDVLMTKLASFVKETDVGVIAVVHLKRGKEYNEGAAISLTDMRGSAAIEQLSFNVLAIERDQQDPETRRFAQLRSLKCRVTGETGEADRLEWNLQRGRYELAGPQSFEPCADGAGDDTPF